MAKRNQMPKPRDGKALDPMTTSPDDDEAQEQDFTRAANGQDFQGQPRVAAEEEAEEDEDADDEDEGLDDDDDDEDEDDEVDEVDDLNQPKAITEGL